MLRGRRGVSPGAETGAENTPSIATGAEVWLGGKPGGVGGLKHRSGGVLTCPIGEILASYFGKHVVNGLTTVADVAKFRAMEFTQLVRVLIIEGRH